MMPPTEFASSGWSTTGFLHTKDGLSTNFDSGATVDSGLTGADPCLIYRVGCMDSLASNYDAHATVPATCYPVKYGCLHPDAINYNCEFGGISQCTWSQTLVTAHDTTGAP